VLSSLFLPLLTLMLLIMNNRSDWVGAEHRNGWKTNAILLLSLFLFGYLVVQELLDRFAAIAG
jgi:hypothetical protein